MPNTKTVYPYIPNSAPETRAAMLEAVGADWHSKSGRPARRTPACFPAINYGPNAIRPPGDYSGSRVSA